MTDFFAVDNHLICTNPACKDYGKMHPNCLCYDKQGNPLEPPGTEAGYTAKPVMQAPAPTPIPSVTKGGGSFFAPMMGLMGYGLFKGVKKGIDYLREKARSFGFAEGGEVPSFAEMQAQSSPTPDQTSSDQDIPTFAEMQDQSTPTPTPMPGPTPEPEVLPSFAEMQNQSQAEPTEADTSGWRQKVLGVEEGVLTGLTGPFGTMALKGLGALGLPSFSGEQINARSENILSKEAKGLTMAGSLAGGIGLPGAITKGVAAMPALENAHKIWQLGAAGLKAFAEGVGLSAGDEVSKSLLGNGSS